MEYNIGIEMTENYKSFEVALGASKLVKDVMLAKPGENVVVSYDSTTDKRVADAIGNAAYAIGAMPTVVYYPTLKGAYVEPPAPVAGAVANADVWIELTYATTMHTDSYRKAVDVNGARYICLTGLDVEMLVKTVSSVDYDMVIELGEYFKARIEKADEIIIKSKEGTNLKAYMRGRKVRHSGQKATQKGYPIMLCGQTSWCPVEETIEGTLVFDGSIFPPTDMGQLKHPVFLEFRQGRITDVHGEGTEAERYKNWLDSFKDPNMYRLAHYSQGFNPGVTRLTGRIVEDERVFGCMEFGIGSQGVKIGGAYWNAAAHTDGIVLHPTIILDGDMLEEDGVYIDETARELAKKLGAAGY